MFTNQEIEQILREGWSDAEMVGGFSTPNCRQSVLNELISQFGNVFEGFTLIGQTGWCDFEEGGQITLWIKECEGTLWTFTEMTTVYGTCGEDFLAEIEPCDMDDWMLSVRTNKEHNDNFQGY